MAVLSDADRTEIHQNLMNELSNIRQSIDVNKTSLRAVINAADAWAEANAASYNSAIPQPARNNLTAEQKARILMYVIRQRWLRS